MPVPHCGILMSSTGVKYIHSFSLLIKASSCRAHSSGTLRRAKVKVFSCAQWHYYYSSTVFFSTYSLCTLPARWRMEAGGGSDSRLFPARHVSRVFAGSWKGLFSSDSGEAFSGIPLTWPYRRNMLWPRVGRGQAERDHCVELSAGWTDERERERERKVVRWRV